LSLEDGQGSIDRVEGLEPVTSQRLQSGLGNVISPRVTGFVADDLAGAVDGEQRLELPDVASERHTREHLAKERRRRRFMTVSAAAMINPGLPASASEGAVRDTRQALATSRPST